MTSLPELAFIELYLDTPGTGINSNAVLGVKGIVTGGQEIEI